MRRSYFKQPFSSKYSYCEDFALLHHIVFYINTCRYIHKALYIYRQLETSIVHDKNKVLDNLILGITLYKKRYKYFKKEGVDVPDIGVYLSMLNYCFEYNKNINERTCKKYRRIYDICIKKLRNNKKNIITSKCLNIKTKIKYIIVVLGMAEFLVDKTRLIDVSLILRKFRV